MPVDDDSVSPTELWDLYQRWRQATAEWGEEFVARHPTIKHFARVNERIIRTLVSYLWVITADAIRRDEGDKECFVRAAKVLIDLFEKLVQNPNILRVIEPKEDNNEI